MSSFLQSREWEELQNLAGRRTWRAGETLLVKHDLPFGFHYLYCPRPENLYFLEEAEEIARKSKAVYLKIDPGQNLDIPIPKKFWLVPSNSLQPQKTFLLNLEKTEAELLAKMHEKTRYNIRLAERAGVEVAKSEDSISFWNMLEETARRDSFFTHEKGYYQKLLEVKSSEFSNELFFARYKGEVIAAVLTNFYMPSRTAVYLHGASTRTHREVMAPHFLHWRIMLEAQKRGIIFYDLGGVDEKKWPGVTRFKKGFGGTLLVYPPSIDIIYRPALYTLYRVAKLLRKK